MEKGSYKNEAMSQINLYIPAWMKKEILEKQKHQGKWFSNWVVLRFKQEFHTYDALSDQEQELIFQLEQIREQKENQINVTNPELQLTEVQYNWWLSRGSAMINEEASTASDATKEFKNCYSSVKLTDQQCNRIAANIKMGRFMRRDFERKTTTTRKVKK